MMPGVWPYVVTVPTGAGLWRPIRITLVSLLLGLLLLIALALVAGFVPLQKRNATLLAEAADCGHKPIRV